MTWLQLISTRICLDRLIAWRLQTGHCRRVAGTESHAIHGLDLGPSSRDRWQIAGSVRLESSNEETRVLDCSRGETWRGAFSEGCSRCACRHVAVGPGGARTGDCVRPNSACNVKCRTERRDLAG